jgi:hypothetical protein
VVETQVVVTPRKIDATMENLELNEPESKVEKKESDEEEVSEKKKKKKNKKKNPQPSQSQ